jgi:hypothetical protein
MRIGRVLEGQPAWPAASAAIQGAARPSLSGLPAVCYFSIAEGDDFLASWR